MKKALMIGAMAVAAITIASSVQAKDKTYNFGFYTNSGSAYCNGLTITVTGDETTGKQATGMATYDQTYCPYPADYIGGFEGHVKALGKGRWFTMPISFTTGDYESTFVVETMYINIKAKTWFLSAISTYDAIPFEVFNGGILGVPLEAKSGVKQLGPLSKAVMAKIKAAHVSK